MNKHVGTKRAIQFICLCNKEVVSNVSSYSMILPHTTHAVQKFHYTITTNWKRVIKRKQHCCDLYHHDLWQYREKLLVHIFNFCLEMSIMWRAKILPMELFYVYVLFDLVRARTKHTPGNDISHKSCTFNAITAALW